MNELPTENKEYVITRKGDTLDIVKEILNTYKKYSYQVQVIAEKFRGKNVFDTCQNIANYITANVTYECDPNGVQWVRTPARLLKDKKGDCKSFAIFQNSILTALGYENGFRFVSYARDGDYTHVYSIIKDANGVTYPFDVVALTQINLPLFQEKKYLKKLDLMNETTKISRLCGVDDFKTAFNDYLTANPARGFSDKMPLWYNSGNACNLKLKGITHVYDELDLADDTEANNQYQMQTAFENAFDAMYNYYGTKGATDQELLNIGMIAAGAFAANKSASKAISNYVEGSNKVFTISDAVSTDARYIAFLALWQKYMCNTNSTKRRENAANTLKMAEMFFKGTQFLYAVVDDSLLNSVQKTKKKNCLTVINNLLVSVNANLDQTDALALIYSGICYLTNSTPNNFIKILKKNKNPKIGETTTTATDTKATTTTGEANVYTKWIEPASNILLKWFNSLKSSSSSSSDSTGASNTVKYVASSSDFSDTMSSILPYVILGGGAFLLIKSMSNKKHKK